VSVKIRLMRVGKKKQPTYRVVVADSRSPRDGRFIEILGQYAPRSVVKIDGEKALAWIEKGAQPTEQVGKLLEITGVWEQYRAKHGSPAASAPKPHAPKAPAAKAASEGAA
jgi:small subunit ribosomal protein S16